MQNQKIKIIFFGTPKFAETILQALLKQENFEIEAIITAPDKPVGRKQILTQSEVKILAQENNIPVLQPEIFDYNFINELKKNHSDLFVFAAYGKIVPQEILNIPKFGSLNIHPSLLPKYRGASPIHATLLNGDNETGVTIMLMDEKMDHGDIISNFQIPISNTDNHETLLHKLAEIGANVLIKTIPNYLSGKIKPIEQEHQKATFCKIIKKENGQIDFNEMPAEKIYNMWHAYITWPGIFSKFCIKNKKITIKFIEIKLTDVKSEATSGNFFVKNKKLYVSCKNNNTLEIIKLQPIGKKEINAQEFINGYLKK